MSPTRERILGVARRLFNQHGLHRVGVRDVARACELSPGNLAYHFATKDALVSALVRELHELNARSVFSELPDDFSLVGLFEAAVAVMNNMLEYRFLLLSYLDAVTASPELTKLEVSLDVNRRARHDVMIGRLIDNGHVDGRRYRPRADRLYELSQIISSGWLTRAMLQSGWQSDREIVLHYAKLGLSVLEPYLTPKGGRQLRRILAGEHDC